MNTLKVISALMDYPSQDLVGYRDELIVIVEHEAVLPPRQQAELIQFINDLLCGDLMVAQESYGQLFDRGRALSLLLFEHVHGESRERGQAMVDLMQVYQENGFEIKANELPDYMPLYLEYLSQRPDPEAREWLKDISHITALLVARLAQRVSGYSVLFASLVALAGVELDHSELCKRVAGEDRDDTPEAIDKIWEDEAVRFGGDSQIDSCSSVSGAPRNAQETEQSPLQWVEDKQRTLPPLA